MTIQHVSIKAINRTLRKTTRKGHPVSPVRIGHAITAIKRN